MTTQEKTNNAVEIFTDESAIRFIELMEKAKAEKKENTINGYAFVLFNNEKEQRTTMLEIVYEGTHENSVKVGRFTQAANTVHKFAAYLTISGTGRKTRTTRLISWELEENQFSLPESKLEKLPENFNIPDMFLPDNARKTRLTESGLVFDLGRVWKKAYVAMSKGIINWTEGKVRYFTK